MVHLNVELSFIYSIFSSLALAIGDVAITNYLYILTGNQNLWIGIYDGIQGIMQLLTSIPAGVCADKYSKTRLIKIGGLIGIITAAFNIYFLLSSINNNILFYCFMFCFAMWGISIGFISPIEGTLYSNSLRNGDQRTSYTMRRSSLINLSYAIGPILSLILFSCIGNDWNQFTLTTVWLVSLGISIFHFIPLFYYEDVDDQTLLPLLSNESTKESIGQLIEKSTNESTKESTKESTNESTTTSIGFSRSSEFIRRCCLCSDILCALGSGATVKFWPLFYRTKLNLSPVQVNLLYVVQAILLVFSIELLGKLIKCGFGRLKLSLSIIFIGIGCLLIIILMESEWHNNSLLICTLSVIRTVFMNCPTAIMSSILIDHVPTHSRGKWISFESLTSAGWYASAAIGGYICDNYGYGATFYLTFALQFAANICILPVLKYER